MSVQNLLSRLDKVKPTGKNTWKACCPAHRGTKQSLTIKDDNGKVLVHCFAEQCSIQDIFGAVGLDFADVMPKPLGEHKPQKKPFYASDVLQIAGDEALVAYLIVRKMLDNTVTDLDRERLLQAASRLRHCAYVSNEGVGVEVQEKFKNQRIVERIVDDE